MDQEKRDEEQVEAEELSEEELEDAAGGYGDPTDPPPPALPGPGGH